jgi:crotonobetainyl-CoA:carnitine CoA-transferase CaiB-like acyl-CoA transferase
VFITNLPHAVRRRLKITCEHLSQGRPRLIYASLTAYGETGPQAEKSGFDATAYWARSGLMDMIRPEESMRPIRPVGGIGDLPVGCALYAAIASALYRRERTGKGGLVSASLLAGGIYANAQAVQGKLCGVEVPPIWPRDGILNACVYSYRCRDGRWINFNLLNEEKLFVPLLRVLGLAQLADDPKFATRDARRKNAQELIARFDQAFATQDIDTWGAALDSVGMVWDRISRLEDIVDDAQLRAIGMVVPTASDPNLWTLSTPFQVEGAAVVPAGPPPGLGEHTREVLAEARFDERDIERLLLGKVVFEPAGGQ